MPARIDIIIDLPEDMEVHASFGSLLHGFIMEIIDPAWAGVLHSSALKPFSQHILPLGGSMALWRVCALDSRAAENILAPLLDPGLTSIHLKQKNKTMNIKKKEYTELPRYGEMAEYFYLHSVPERKMRLRFRTPTSFKSGGKYQIMPRIDHIYQSIMNRWNAFAGDVRLDGQEVLQHLADHTGMSGYHLKTVSFHLEGVKIPAFAGWADFTVRGPDAMARIANLLLYYAGISGVGIKTSLGMGGVSIGKGFIRTGG